MFSGLLILVLRSSSVRFAPSESNKFSCLKYVLYVITLITLMNASATPAIVTSTIGSRADVSAGYCRSRVVRMSKRQRCTEYSPYDAFNSCSWPIIPEGSFFAIFRHILTVFPWNIDRFNPRTTVPISTLHIIATATALMVFPRMNSSATSAHGISKSQTHLLTMNPVAQTWWARNFNWVRPAIEYLVPGTWSSINWEIGQAFSRLTAWPRY